MSLDPGSDVLAMARLAATDDGPLLAHAAELSRRGDPRGELELEPALFDPFAPALWE